MKKDSLLNKFEEHQIRNLRTVTGGIDIECFTHETTNDDGSTHGQDIGSDGHVEGEWND